VVDVVSVAAVRTRVVAVGVPDSTMVRKISLAVEFLTFLVEPRSLEGVSNENIGVLDSLRAILHPAKNNEEHLQIHVIFCEGIN